jgi:uncharacterized membrane protein
LVTLVEKRSKDIIENIPSGALLAFWKHQLAKYVVHQITQVELQ